MSRFPELVQDLFGTNVAKQSVRYIEKAREVFGNYDEVAAATIANTQAILAMATTTRQFARKVAIKLQGNDRRIQALEARMLRLESGKTNISNLPRNAANKGGLAVKNKGGRK